MPLIDDVRERHIRRFILIFLLIVFARINWGNTIEGLYHLVLSVRSSFLETVDGELASDLGRTILPFGKSISVFLILGFAWFVFDQLLKWADWDAEYRFDEITELKRQNQSLIDNLRTANTDLAVLSQSIEHIASNNQILAKQQDRVVELGIELEKLSLKTNRKPTAEKIEDPQDNTIGLFEPVKKKTHGKISSSFRRRAKPTPKF